MHDDPIVGSHESNTSPILVTGATGFIGSHLTRNLVQAGHRVRALVRAGSNLERLHDVSCERVTGDVRDTDSLRRAMNGATKVFHCAALASDWGSWSDFRSVNVDGTRNLLDAARCEPGLQRFVHISTTDVYGYPSQPCAEDHPLKRCGLPYNETKIAAEELVWQAFSTSALPVTIIRPATVYGPGSVSLIGSLATALSQGPMVLVGDGSAGAGLVFIDDVISALLILGEHPEAVGKAFNIVDTHSASWAELVAALAAELRVQHRVVRIPPRLATGLARALELASRLGGGRSKPALTVHSVRLMGTDQNYQNTFAREQVGWMPRTPLSSGLAASVRWWKSTQVGAAVSASHEREMTT